MKRIILTVILLLITLIPIRSQRKIQDLHDGYDRNGLSVLIITHGDNYDNEIKEAFEKLNKGDKFDINPLSSNTLKVKYGRVKDSQGWTERKQEIHSLITNGDYGKQILSYIYNRQADGTMDVNRILERGRYNANDNMYIQAQAGVLGESILDEQGYDLINQSYLLVIDFTNIEQKKDLGITYYMSAIEGQLYQIQYNEASNQYLFENVWIYEDDTEEIRKIKKENFERMKVPLNNLTSLYNSAVVGESFQALVTNGYFNMITLAENKEEALAVKVSVTGRNPIRAKIGKKEGLRNGRRFYAYEYRQDTNGNTFAVRRGIVRATKVADNRYNATGDMETSEFCQISGYNIQQGYTLRQKNDLGMSVMLGYHYGSHSGVDLQLDYLLHINTQGISHYLLLDANMDLLKPGKYWEKQANVDPDLWEAPNMTAFNVALGYGLGVRFARLFEVVPYMTVGMDHIGLGGEYDKESENYNDEDFSKKLAWTGTGGVKLNINLVANTQLVLGADYTFFFAKEDEYKKRYEYLKPTGSDTTYRSRDGFGLLAGFKFMF